MVFDYKIFWTKEAVRNLEEILDYLSNTWTQREVNEFKRKLSKQIRLIRQNPNLFPISRYNSRLRKSVLGKQTIIFYEVLEQVIYLVYLFNTRQNIERIKQIKT